MTRRYLNSLHDGEYNDTQFLYIGVATAKISSLLKHNKFLNQARAGHRPAHAWFLKIDPVRTSVCVCVCVRPRGY